MAETWDEATPDEFREVAGYILNMGFMARAVHRIGRLEILMAKGLAAAADRIEKLEREAKAKES
jgi:hypothetical protein